MAVENENYKLEILEYAINQCIDRLLPKSSEDALSVILYKSNEVVWRVATEIYTKSGHQIDFLFVKDILNLRIESLRNKIAEETRIWAELEAQRLAREIEQEKIRKENEAEEERIRVELEARKRIREAEEEIIRKEQERIDQEKKEKQQKRLREFKEANPEIYVNDYEELKAFLAVFEIIKNVIVEQLDVNGEEINKEEIELDTILTRDLGVEDKYDNFCGHWERIELVMGIEAEFDLEIFDEEQEKILSRSVGQLVNLVMRKI